MYIDQDKLAKLMERARKQGERGDYTFSTIKYSYNKAPQITLIEYDEQFFFEITYRSTIFMIRIPSDTLEDQDFVRKQIQMIITTVDDHFKEQKQSRFINILGLFTFIGVVTYLLLEYYGKV